MPVHCAVYIEPGTARRLTCLKLEQPRDAAEPDRIVLRFGAPTPQQPPLQRLLCTCAPVHDYSGRQVARVGLFAHAAEERPFETDQTAGAAELARLLSLRLGYLSAAGVGLRTAASG